MLHVVRGGRFSIELSVLFARRLSACGRRSCSYSFCSGTCLCKHLIILPSWSPAGILRSLVTSQELVSGGKNEKRKKNERMKEKNKKEENEKI